MIIDNNRQNNPYRFPMEIDINRTHNFFFLYRFLSSGTGNRYQSKIDIDCFDCYRLSLYRLTTPGLLVIHVEAQDDAEDIARSIFFCSYKWKRVCLPACAQNVKIGLLRRNGSTLALPGTPRIWKRFRVLSKPDRGTQRQFSENICSEDDLRSRIFGTFVVKFLACLPVLDFRASKNCDNCPFLMAFYSKKVT